MNKPIKSEGEAMPEIEKDKANSMKLRQLCWQVADLLDEAGRDHFDYVIIRGAKEAGRSAVYMGFDLALGDGTENIESLFQKWVALGCKIGNSDTPDTPLQLSEYTELQRQITSMTPETVRDLAILFYVETDGGLSDYREDFMSRVFAFCGMENLNTASGAEAMA